ncbi:MAG: helix-turn-helix transcriptional regulator [Bacteroidota bacterium]
MKVQAKMKIGRKIRIIREIRGYTQEYLAIQLEISQTAYSRIENETVKLDLVKLEGIAEILELDLISLLSFDMSKFNQLLRPNDFVVNSNNTNILSDITGRLVQLEKKIENIQSVICIQ